jgi:hypothetical protein
MSIPDSYSAISPDFARADVGRFYSVAWAILRMHFLITLFVQTMLIRVL